MRLRQHDLHRPWRRDAVERHGPFAFWYAFREDAPTEAAALVLRGPSPAGLAERLQALGGRRDAESGSWVLPLEAKAELRTLLRELARTYGPEHWTPVERRFVAELLERRLPERVRRGDARRLQTWVGRLRALGADRDPVSRTAFELVDRLAGLRREFDLLEQAVEAPAWLTGRQAAAAVRRAEGVIRRAADTFRWTLAPFRGTPEGRRYASALADLLRRRRRQVRELGRYFATLPERPRSRTVPGHHPRREPYRLIGDD